MKHLGITPNVFIWGLQPVCHRKLSLAERSLLLTPTQPAPTSLTLPQAYPRSPARGNVPPLSGQGQEALTASWD